ncbi:MAG: DUF4494 domain-containing protein [Muribaculaceae bacterium]
MAQWIETKLRYDKVMENGAVKKVNEPYLVDALSFAEAEARIIEEMRSYISGDFTVEAVKKAKIAEVFGSDTASRWWKVRVAFITINERSGTEKRDLTDFLVAGEDLEDALSTFKQNMKGTLADYEVTAITETAIIDIFPEDLSNNK